MKYRDLSPQGRPHRAVTAALTAALLIGTPAAEALVLDATLVSLGGASYRWDYVLTNNGSLGAGVAVASFDIAFLESTITSWTEIGGSNAAWSEYSVPVLTDDLFGADVDLGAEIADGDSAAFSVTFNWNGALLPGSQAYTVYDPTNNFQILETGSTTVASVPSPSTASLLWLPLLALLAPGLARSSRWSRSAAS
jgi:hypothetical protein